MVQLTDKHWAVEVPDGNKITAVQKGDSRMIIYSGERIVEIISSNWQYLFTTKGCTEEQAAEVVEYVVSDMVRGYRDYDSLRCKEVIEAIVETPQQSITSLLKSKGCDINKNWAIIQKQNDNDQ